MEIVWYGLGCFRLTERGYPSVVIDPFDEDESGLRLPRGAADIVLSSQLVDDPIDARWPGLTSVGHAMAAPGEYEIGGVFVTGVATSFHHREGRPIRENVIYAVNYEGVVVCHLGELALTPTHAQVEAIGRVNVLLVPVGMDDGLTMTMASETVSMIEPDIVIPMQYATPGLKLERGLVDGFLKEMAVAHPTTIPSLKITAGAEPEEIQIVLLEPVA